MHGVKFSAKIEYSVNSWGKADVIESRIIQNDTEDRIELGPYEEALPPRTDYGTLNVYHKQQNGSRKRIEPTIKVKEGSDRRKLLFPRMSFGVGSNEVITEFSIHSFYQIANPKGTCVFWFHHSLPELDFLQDIVIPKTITVIIEKPSWFFSTWNTIFIHQPTNDYTKYLRSFAKQIKFEFHFELSVKQHYFNTIVLQKARRFNFLSELWSILVTEIKKRSNPK